MYTHIHLYVYIYIYIYTVMFATKGHLPPLRDAGARDPAGRPARLDYYWCDDVLLLVRSIFVLSLDYSILD